VFDDIVLALLRTQANCSDWKHRFFSTNKCRIALSISVGFDKSLLISAPASHVICVKLTDCVVMMASHLVCFMSLFDCSAHVIILSVATVSAVYAVDATAFSLFSM